jgi:hypothetical protein
MYACLATALVGLASPSLHAEESASPASPASSAAADSSAPAAVAAPAPSPAPSDPLAPANTAALFSQPAWELVISPYAYHWSNQEGHTNVYLIGVEHDQGDGFLWGLSYFQNSFGQPSGYGYYGYTWNNLFPSHPAWYFKLTGGIIYGYKGEHANDVPFNHNGFGLGIIPGVGYRVTPKDAVQVNLLGSAGLIFTYNHRF